MEEASLVDHLTELRARLVKSIVVIASCFILLIYFSNDIYQFLAEPLQKFLPWSKRDFTYESLDVELTLFSIKLKSFLSKSCSVILGSYE